MVKSTMVNMCVSNTKKDGYEDNNSIGNSFDMETEVSKGVWIECQFDDDNRLYYRVPR